ncbi:MAG: ABC transporter permease [Myxococcota bacterium]
MKPEGYVELSLATLRRQRTRSILSMLGVAIGIAAVILLTSIGEGTRRYLLSEFMRFGTNILEVTAGKTETGGHPGMFGGTTHKLDLDDAEAIRRLPDVRAVVPVAVGQARVEANRRGRSVFIYGANAELPEVWKFQVGQGVFLPPGDSRRGALVAVLGPTVKRELFGDANALGRFVRIASHRLRVIGVMAPRGRMLGFDIDDAAYVPVATATKMFNLEELQEIDVLFTHEGLAAGVTESIRRLLTERHGGREDFTITTQSEMLEVFDNVMRGITAAVGAIGAISLLVGAIGVFTMMWISVGERVGEIGLLRALGGTRSEVRTLFLLEAVIVTLIGGVLGIAAGLGIASLLRIAAPGLPIFTPLGYVFAAVLVSALAGLIAGVLPARRAAALEPTEALRAE